MTIADPSQTRRAECTTQPRQLPSYAFHSGCIDRHRCAIGIKAIIVQRSALATLAHLDQGALLVFRFPCRVFALSRHGGLHLGIAIHGYVLRLGGKTAAWPPQ